MVNARAENVVSGTRLGTMLLLVLLDSQPARADLYRDLVHGDDEARSEAALVILRDPHAQAAAVVRRALYTVTRIPQAKHLPHVTNIVKDETLSVSTRAAAALALGLIGRNHPKLWPPGAGEPPVHQPLPVFAQNALRSCVEPGNPKTLRRACAEALGTAKVPGALELLAPLVADAAEEPIVRLFAGRAVTRLTGVLAVSADLVSAVTGMVGDLVAP